MTDMLQFGIAKRDITPPAGKPMGAFPVSRNPLQPRTAEGAHDPLHARAFALRQGDTTLVVCAGDVLSFAWPDVDQMREDFAGRTGLQPQDLIVCGTHNHNGPECTYLFAGSADDPYIAEMRRLVVEAACEAVETLEPVTLSVGAVETDLSYNRREILPDGQLRWHGKNPERLPVKPVDPKATVLRLDGPSGAAVGGILHFAAHPVIMTTPNRLFTAGYPGAALRHFEAGAGLPASVFLQGACGDTHPYQAIRNDFDAVEEMGRGLGEAAASAWKQAAPQPNISLAVERRQEELPHRYSPDHSVRIELTVLRIGPRLAMVFWQGEAFVELSLSLQWRSPFARTIVCAYSLGWIGYVPNRRAYEYGGYGVDLYEADPPAYGRTSVPPGTGEQLVDWTGEMLCRRYEKTSP